MIDLRPHGFVHVRGSIEIEDPLMSKLIFLSALRYCLFQGGVVFKGLVGFGSGGKRHSGLAEDQGRSTPR